MSEEQGTAAEGVAAGADPPPVDDTKQAAQADKEGPEEEKKAGGPPGGAERRAAKAAAPEGRLKPPTKHEYSDARQRAAGGRETPVGRGPSQGAGGRGQGSKLPGASRDVAPPPTPAQKAKSADERAGVSAGNGVDKAEKPKGQEKPVEKPIEGDKSPANPLQPQKGMAGGLAAGGKAEADAKREAPADVREQPASSGHTRVPGAAPPAARSNERPADAPREPGTLSLREEVPGRTVDRTDDTAADVPKAAVAPQKAAELAEAAARDSPIGETAAPPAEGESADSIDSGAARKEEPVGGMSQRRDVSAAPTASAPAMQPRGIASFPVAIQQTEDQGAAPAEGRPEAGMGGDVKVGGEEAEPAARAPSVPAVAQDGKGSSAGGDGPKVEVRGGAAGSANGAPTDAAAKGGPKERREGGAAPVGAPTGFQEVGAGEADPHSDSVEVVEEVVLIPTFGSGMTRDEVEELNEEFIELLTELGIDAHKYFARGLDEFNSPADFYEELSRRLDEDDEEVDITETLATRLGDDHPLVVELQRREALEDVRKMDVHLKESLGAGKSKKIFVKSADEFRTPLEYYIFLQERTKKQGLSLVPLMEDLLGTEHPLPRALAGDMPKTAIKWQSWKKSKTLKIREASLVKPAKAEEPVETEHFGCMDCIVYWFGLK